MQEMSTKRLQIAERARNHKGEALHNLQQFIDVAQLEESYRKLNKQSASGTDGENWYEYGQRAKERLPELLNSFKTGTYKAPHIRRVYIKKDDGSKRPLGIPTIEDKVLQASVVSILEPIYEEDFKEFSYGFRPKRSPHQAIEYMYKEVSYQGIRYIIDADLKNYFGSISHEHLRAFLARRMKDGVIKKMIDKWLKAGILEDGQLYYPDEGTPQGGIISPLLSNIYLHYVLDEWFSEEIQPRLKEGSLVVRYADDFILGFRNKEDAQRVMEVLPKRFGKYKLTLHPDKTRMIDLDIESGDGSRSFDFLGFTHFKGSSRKGNLVLKRKTSKKKLTKSLKQTDEWLKRNRNMKLKALIAELNAKLRGHYSYYGITFNMKGIMNFFVQCKMRLLKWLNRRGGRRALTWVRFNEMISTWIPLIRPRIYHSYLSANPN